MSQTVPPGRLADGWGGARYCLLRGKARGAVAGPDGTLEPPFLLKFIFFLPSLLHSPVTTPSRRLGRPCPGGVAVPTPSSRRPPSAAQGRAAVRALPASRRGGGNAAGSAAGSGPAHPAGDQGFDLGARPPSGGGWEARAAGSAGRGGLGKPRRARGAPSFSRRFFCLAIKCLTHVHEPSDSKVV